MAVEQLRPVCWSRSPEIHFEFAPPTSCGGSVTALGVAAGRASMATARASARMHLRRASTE